MSSTNPQDARWWEGGKQVEASQEFTPRRLDTPLDRLTRKIQVPPQPHAH